MKNSVNVMIQAINEVFILDSAFSLSIQLFVGCLRKQVTKHVDGIKEVECIIQ